MTTWDWVLRPPALRDVDVAGVGRAFGRFEALDRVSLQFTAGTITAVVGPNGAGKTTLLQLLATLDRPSEGRIVFDGRWDATVDRQLVRPHLGLVAHDSLLYGDLTARENLAFVAELYGLERSVVGRWLERVGLAHAADRVVHTFSRGMKQRLSIARALLQEPSVVLFDEPLTGLDRSARVFLFSLLRWLRAQERTVIVVTHHLDWPTDTLDRVVAIVDGRVRFNAPIGADESLAERYVRAVERA